MTDSTIRRALVVDDEEELRSIMVIDLEGLGFEVREAGSVEAATELIASAAFDFDVLITDLKFPASSGLELARWVQARTGRRLFVVVVSGLVSDDMRKALVEAGVAAILEKPYLEEEFAVAIGTAVAKRDG